mgnify:CR=1 FL=1
MIRENQYFFLFQKRNIFAGQIYQINFQEKIFAKFGYGYRGMCMNTK